MNCAIFVGVLLLTLPIVTTAANNSQTLFVPGDSPYGKSFLDWAKEWWKWNFSLDKSVHPIIDPNPEKCASQNQSANVRFLPVPDPTVTEFTFTCTVPQGKAIVVANLNTGESDSCITPGDKAIKDAATGGQKGASLKVWLDGVNQNYSLNDMRVTSDFFNLSFAKNNIANAPEGTCKAMIDGYYIFLKPLTPGKHNLHFDSEVTNNPGFDLGQKGNWIFNVK